ncbi:MAG: DUF4283 domain-containing protein ['Waltheria sp.' little leaf phytoplasma]|nr:DUF4283 domain-containing protein ['Waltheria sp.' little leaf phytoplasma]
MSVQDFPKLPASGKKDSGCLPEGEKSKVSTEGVASVTQHWKQLFSVKEDNSLEFFEPEAVDGRIRVKPPPEVLAEGVKQWENTVVAQCLGRMPNLGQFQKAVSLLWGKDGGAEVKLAGNNLFLIQFKDERTCKWVVEGGPWHILNRMVIVRKWRPGLRSLDFKMERIPVWVNLHQVPLEYFTKRGMSYLASAMGHPLHMDNFTAQRKKVGFARVCVEIDLRKELPKDFDVELADGSFATVVVEVPWTPPVCKKCSQFGHEERFCPQKPVWKEKKVDAAKAGMAQVDPSPVVEQKRGKEKMHDEVNPTEEVVVSKNQFALLNYAKEAAGSCSKQGEAELALGKSGEECLDHSIQEVDGSEGESVGAEEELEAVAEEILFGSPRKTRAAAAGVARLMKVIKQDQQKKISSEAVQNKGASKGRRKKGRMKPDGEKSTSPGNPAPSLS